MHVVCILYLHDWLNFLTAINSRLVSYFMICSKCCANNMSTFLHWENDLWSCCVKRNKKMSLLSFHLNLG